MPAPDPNPPLADAWPSGHLIGNFELRGALSRGASGIVYRGWDHTLGVAVAIKEHLPSALARRSADGDVHAADAALVAAWDASLQSFLDGSRLLARCDDPSLVRVLHLQLAHGTAYRIMAWVDGEPLREVRRRMSRPPNEPALRAVLDDLLDALDAVHHVAGVHGGVHPEQILLTNDGRSVLLGPNFGVIDEGAAAGPWTDLRALAGVARFCISGMLTTAEDHPAEPTAEIVERLYFDDPSVRYGAEFMTLLDNAMALDVTLRPQSVAQFRGRLERAQRSDAARLAAPAAVAPPSPRDATDTPIAAAPVAVGASVIERLSAPRAPRVDVPLQRSSEGVGERSEPALGSGALRGAPPPADIPAAAPRPAAFSIGWALVVAAIVASAAITTWIWSRRAPAPVPVPARTAEPLPVRPVTPVTPATVTPAVTPAPQAAAASAATTATPTVATAAPAAVAPPAVEPEADVGAAPTPRTPREACGARSNFALYYCMQQQCARSGWAEHPQCVRFMLTDEVE